MTWNWIIFVMQVIAFVFWVVAAIAMVLAVREYNRSVKGILLWPNARFRSSTTKPKDP